MVEPVKPFKSLTDLNVLGNYQTFDSLLRSAPHTDTESTVGKAPFRREDEQGQDVIDASIEETETLLSEPPSALADQDNISKIMLALMWTIAWLSALDRVAMSVALLPMTDEFGYTDSIKGSISSFFSVGYGLSIIPAGIIVANTSPRMVMAVGLSLWSLSTVATPIAAESGFAAMLVVRTLVGAGESVLLPTMQRLLQSWLRPDEKSVAQAIILSGFQAGTITAYLLSPLVMEELGGWRSLFYVYGGFGLMILVPWLVLAQDGPIDTSGSLGLPVKDIPPDATFSLDSSIQTFRDAPWKAFSQSKAVWAMIITHCAKNWGMYITLAWTPIFYSEAYDLSDRDSAWLSVVPSVAGAAGGFLAGTLADSYIGKLDEVTDDEVEKVRKVFQGLALYVPAAALASLAWHIPEEPLVAQTLLMVAVGFSAFGAAGNEAAVQEKAGERWIGLLYSVTSLPAVLVGTFGVWLTGQILDLTNQDWSFVFGLNAAVNVIGGTAFIALYNSKREFE